MSVSCILRCVKFRANNCVFVMYLEVRRQNSKKLCLCHISDGESRSELITVSLSFILRCARFRINNCVFVIYLEERYVQS